MRLLQSCRRFFARRKADFRQTIFMGPPRPDDPALFPAHNWNLDAILLRWNSHDAFCLSDCFTGIQVFGSTGSGKSSGPINLFVRTFMDNGFGMLLLTAKGTDAADYVRMAEQSGRAHEVVLIGPKHSASINFVAEVMSEGTGLVSNLTSVLSIVSRMAMGSGEGGGGDREAGGFWAKMDQRLISASAEVIIRAGEPITTLNLERIVQSLPTSRAMVADEQWQRSSYLYQCLRFSESKLSGAVDDADRDDFRRLADFFLLEFSQLSDKTRSTVQTSVCSTLDLFNRGDIRRVLSSSSPTLTMTDIQQGKILIVDAPALVYGAAGCTMQTVINYVFQLAQNRRDVKANPRPVAVVIDESQLLIDLEHQAKFQTTARATRTCTLLSTQSLSNYLSQNGGAAAEARTHALMANLQTLIVCNTSDAKTVEYMQNLYGRRRQVFMNASSSKQNEDLFAQAFGLGDNGSTNAGISESMEFLVQAEHFYQLARGGPQNNWIVQGLLYQGGKTFSSTGKPFMPVNFVQQPS